MRSCDSGVKGQAAVLRECKLAPSMRSLPVTVVGVGSCDENAYFFQKDKSSSSLLGPISFIIQAFLVALCYSDAVFYPI